MTTWNIHPGEILREEFMIPMKLSSRKLAASNDIVLERRGITADTALRIANFFDTTPILDEYAGILRTQGSRTEPD